MKNKIVVLLLTVFILCLIPISHTYLETRNSWSGIVPSYIDDDLYYYARMENVAHGYPLIGNPYYFEHRNEISPAFFVSDWLSSIPLLLGLSLPLTAAFNFIFWSILFSLIAYYIFRECFLSVNASIISAIITYIGLYNLLLRPVSMQIVGPFFLFFCIAYIKWIKEEIPTKLQNIYLCLATVLSFYIYTYLLQVVVIILGITFLWLLKNKEWRKLKQLVIVGLSTFVLILPFIFLTVKQISSANYWDTMSRIGLVNTHIPTMLSFYDGGYILIILSLWFISFYFFNNFKKDKIYRNGLLFVSISGIGLFFTLFSNIVTGKELEISNHIERFIIIWASLSFCIYFWHFINSLKEFYSLSMYRKLLLSSFFLTFIIIFAQFITRDFGVLELLKTNTEEVQKYAPPLSWLSKNAPKESVIWSNGDIGSYIPIQTTDYNLFSTAGGLQLMSSKESEERYLASHYFDDLTLEEIQADFRKYAGVGNAVHQYKTYNRKVQICIILKLSFFGANCGKLTDPVSFKGGDYFTALYDQYMKDIKPHISAELKKFHVKYLVRDKRINDKFIPNKTVSAKLLWSDENFEIYSLN
jgi:hypothetical protein